MLNERVVNYVLDFWRRGEVFLEQVRQKAEVLIPKMNERGWAMRLTGDKMYVKVSVEGCQPLRETLDLSLESIAQVLWSLTAAKELLQERLDLPFDSLMGKPEDFSELTELIEMRERLSTERMMILQNMLSLSENLGYEFVLNATDYSYRVRRDGAFWHCVALEHDAFTVVTELLTDLQKEKEHVMVSAEAWLVCSKILSLVPLLLKHAKSYRWSSCWGHSEQPPEMVLEYGRSMIVKWKDDERQQYNFCEEDYRRLLDDLSERVY